MGEQRNTGHRSRTEPSLGDLNEFQTTASDRTRLADDGRVHKPRGRAPEPSADKPEHGDEPPRRWWRRPWAWLLLVAALLVLGSLAWFNQSALRSLFPRTRLNTLLLRADKALAAGRLEGHDGNSARALYEAVHALEPDNEPAIQGLRKVGEAELERARKAIARHDYDAAQSALGDARELLGGGDAVHAVAQLLIKARQSQVQTDALILQAQQALAQGKLDGTMGAAALYRQALAAEPDNAVALHGMDKVGDALAAQARSALDNGNLDQADTLIGKITALIPGYGDLPSLRAHLAQARQKQQAAVDAYLQAATSDMRAGHLTGNGNANALAQYQAALQLDPDNAKAKAGLGQIAQALLLRAGASIDAKDYQDATTLVAQAAQLAPHSTELATVRSRLQSAQAEAAAQAASPPLDPRQQARVNKLLARAQAALKAGDILLPPGASAYDLYSDVLDIDGNNSAAMQGLRGLAGHATDRFNKALSAGDLAQAGKMLKVLGQLVPGDAAQVGMRRRLADAWLDRAQQNLNTGKRAAVQKALEAARKLRPDSPRLESLRARFESSGNG